MALTQSEVTALLREWSDGVPEARDKLMSLVFDELHHLAAAYMAREAPGHTLQATALVNEFCLKLMGRRTVHWHNRAQFFAFAAEVMGHILVDHARRQKSAKHGGHHRKAAFDEAHLVRVADGVDYEALVEALRKLAAMAPRQGRIVELRYFFGLTIEETAEVLETSAMTVKREWRTARMWLRRELGST